MRIFFDNCISPVLAYTLNGFVSHLGHDAVHIKDLPCGRDAADVAWIAFLSESFAEWLVFTGDLRIHRNRAERLAFRQAGLRGIVLASAYQGFPVNQQASFLLWRWPDIVDVIRLQEPPFLFELPANRTSRIRSLPL